VNETSETTAHPARGARLPTEKRVLADPRTGAEIWQLTAAPCISHAPYFLNPAWAGARRDLLVITSYRAGGPDLFGVRLPDGGLLRLTERGDVSPWSACVSPDGRRVYYTGGRPGRPGELRALDVETLAEAVLAELPPASWLGDCSLSPDGAELALAVRRGDVNALVAFRTDAGSARTLHETPALIAHAQWSPDGRAVLFASDLPRMWLVEADGTDARPLRPQTRREWLVHEAWLTNDEVIFTRWPHALASIRRDGTGERAVAAFNCWHPAPRRDGALVVCDTALPDAGLQLVDPATGRRRVLCYPRASSQGYQWREPEPIWEGPVPEAAYGPQWTHPHPSFTPDGRGVVYTSDVSGHPQVYLAWLPESPGADRAEIRSG
jgi:oligogalacturonide lyase